MIITFLIYSFIGWFLECCAASILKKKYVNRGVLAGPFSCLYGIYIVLSEIFFNELHANLFFLLLGCCVLFGICEWTSGKLLQKIYHKRFWDYTKKPLHIDGYVCLYSMLYGGIMGVIAVRWLNPLIDRITLAIPSVALLAAQIVLLCLIMADILWTHAFLMGLPQKFSSLNKIHNSMAKTSLRINNWVIAHSYRRINKAFPLMKGETAEHREDIFAYGCCFYKLAWLFVFGAFGGDVVETLFCRVTTGVWMSRSSLVIGDFSVVWGLGIAFFTLFLFNYRNRADSFIFIMGTVLGGAFEYICSIFTEIVFGKVFWDYSGFAFNLGGRINLLYCFFWGIAAVVWMKWGYPFLSKHIERLPVRIGKYITWLMCVLMAADMLLSAAALVRYDERTNSINPQNGIERWLDIHYPNDVMERIYPNAKTKI